MKRLFFAALFAPFLPSLLHAQVILNEIMYYPDPNEPEWVELYNAGTESVTIQGWTIREDSNSAGSTPFSAVVPAGEYLVITGDLQKFTERWGEIPSVVIQAGFSYLNNSGGDCVRLRGEAGEKIDEVCYEDSWGGRSGKSLERSTVNGPSQDKGSWGTSVAPEEGTPGRANSILVSSTPHFSPHEKMPLQIFPNPAADYVRIRFPEGGTSGNERLEILDLAGTLLRTYTISLGEMSISLEELPCGIYLLRLRDGNEKPFGQVLEIVR